MSMKASPESITASKTNQTPFGQFKSALNTILSVPKSSLPKPKKTSRKK